MRVSIFNRWPTWDWHVLHPLRGHGDGGYWAFWFGPFKIVIYDKPKPKVEPEPVKLLTCRGCGHKYHPDWNGPSEPRLCPDCSGAT